MKKFSKITLSPSSVQQLGTDEMWENDKYNVIVYRDPKEAPELPQDTSWPKMIWLSIKRIDKSPIHDWRELQQIKNMIVGPENEAVEVYPAESRMVDVSNQFHLWVFEDPKLRLPFGFLGRAVADETQANKMGAKQRPFEKDE